MSLCNFCCSSDIAYINLNYNFVTSDIKRIANKPKTLICKNCMLVQKKIDKNYIRIIDKIYNNYEGFNTYNQLDQTKFIGNKYDSRCNIIYKKVFKNPNINTGKILDFGCSNGAMLAPLLKSETKFDVYGTDVKNHIDKNLSTKKNFKGFIPLKKIFNSKIKFDYIFLIHVFEHLPDIKNFLINIKKILSKKGKIIIQIPNYSQNPFDLLIYDHTYHYNKTSLRRIFNKYSFDYKIDDKLILGEFYIQIFNSKKLTNTSSLNSYLNETMNKVKWLKNQFKMINKYEHISIMGSSVTSLIAINNLKKGKLLKVYDEDKHRIGKKLDRRKIFDFNSYQNEILYLPFYGLKLNKLQSKIKSKYNFLKLI